MLGQLKLISFAFKGIIATFVFNQNRRTLFEVPLGLFVHTFGVGYQVSEHLGRDSF
jgi:hypothetical protein